MRHAVYDFWPIFDAVMPKWRQRVAFDAAMDKKRPAFAQRGDIDTASFFCSGHLLGDRRHIIDRFTG